MVGEETNKLMTIFFIVCVLKANTSVLIQKLCSKNLIIATASVHVRGPVAQWIRHLTTNQGIPGSSPGRVDSFLHLITHY